MVFTHSTISFVILSMTAVMFAMRCFGALNTLIGVGMIVGLRSSEVLHSAQLVAAREELFPSCAPRRFRGGTGDYACQSISCSRPWADAVAHPFRAPRPAAEPCSYGLGGMGVAVLITAVFGTMGSTVAGMLGLGFCAAAIFITRP